MKEIIEKKLKERGHSDPQKGIKGFEEREFDAEFYKDSQNDQVYRQAISALENLEKAIERFADKHGLNWDQKDDMRDLIIDGVFSSVSR